MVTIFSPQQSSRASKNHMGINQQTAERCTSCILPRSTRGLNFNQDGVCDICSMQEKLRETNGDVEEKPGDIEKIIRKMRDLGKHRQYDCLVGFSGGRDSTYLLHQLVRIHKLRCVAAYYRTPFTDDVIEQNVQKTVNLLDVPLVNMKISQEFHRQYARKVLLLWKKTPRPELINLLCAPCKYVNAQVFRIARRYGIKSIVFGGNKYETFQLGAASFSSKPGHHVHSFTSQARRGFLVLKRGISFLMKHPHCVPLIPVGFKASVLYINPHTPYLRLHYSDIVRIDYFRHTKYDESECNSVIISELGWCLPPGCNSYWRADCSMAELKNLLFQRTVGLSYMDAYLSNFLRSGEITRDEALSRLETEGRTSQYRLEHAIRVLGVGRNFLDTQ